VQRLQGWGDLKALRVGAFIAIAGVVAWALALWNA